jgi:predicted protein tyrosine phosphatase
MKQSLLEIVVEGKRYMADTTSDLRRILTAEMNDIKIPEDSKGLVKQLMSEKTKAIKDFDKKIADAKNIKAKAKLKEAIRKTLEKLQ